MWTPAQRKAFSKALATAQQHEAAVAKLKEIAKYSPRVAEQVRELEARLQYVKGVSETAIAVESANGQ